MGDEEDRERLECNTCCYAVSGVPPKIYDKADKHMDENPGHVMKDVYP